MKRVFQILTLFLFAYNCSIAQSGLTVQYPSVKSLPGYIVNLKGDTLSGEIASGVIDNGLLKTIFFTKNDGSRMKFTANAVKSFSQEQTDGTELVYRSMAMKGDEFYFYHKVLDDEFDLYGCYKKNKDFLLIVVDGYVHKVDKWLKQGLEAYVAGDLAREELYYHHNLAMAD